MHRTLSGSVGTLHGVLRLLKISHICPCVGEQMGGSERYVWTLSKHQSRNHDVHIYTTTKYRDRVGTSVLDGVTIHKSYAPVTIWNINPLTFMLPALTKSKSDIFHIHSHLYFSSNQAILAKIMNKRKALLHLHGGVGIPPYKVSMTKLVAKRLYDRTLGKFTIKNSEIIASVSRSDLVRIAEDYDINRSQLRYVPNVVDTEVFKPRNNGGQDKKTLLYLGDLEPWKGIGSLIKWIQNNTWTNQGFRLRIVGQGSYLPYLLALQENKAMFTNGISLDVLGPRNHAEIPAILNESDALVLPSYWEGMPTVVLESMASGIPVISTKVGDIPQLIEHHKTGFLIDRSFSSFQESVDSILTNDSLVKDITSNARKLIEREHCLTRIDDITSRVYAEVMT